MTISYSEKFVKATDTDQCNYDSWELSLNCSSHCLIQCTSLSDVYYYSKFARKSPQCSCEARARSEGIDRPRNI